MNYIQFGNISVQRPSLQGRQYPFGLSTPDAAIKTLTGYLQEPAIVLSSRNHDRNIRKIEDAMAAARFFYGDVSVVVSESGDSIEISINHLYPAHKDKLEKALLEPIRALGFPADKT